MSSSRESLPLWSEAEQLRGLFGLERRWIAERRRAVGPAALWLAPCGLNGSVGTEYLRLDVEPGGGIGGALRGLAAALPFADDSLRCIVLQHALDVEGMPLALLGECVRVLAPAAEILVVGLNPLSAWNPWLRVATRPGRARPRLRMAGRLRAQFGQLGLCNPELCWVGPFVPNARVDEIAPQSSVTGFLRACYVLRMTKPGDTVIPLRTRQFERSVQLHPDFATSAAPRASARG